MPDDAAASTAQVTQSDIVGRSHQLNLPDQQVGFSQRLPDFPTYRPMTGPPSPFQFHASPETPLPWQEKARPNVDTFFLNDPGR